ncbi:MAG: hypothetical protein AABW75_00240 [Nanoarchaeota archaeon]
MNTLSNLSPELEARLHRVYARAEAQKAEEKNRAAQEPLRPESPAQTPPASTSPAAPIIITPNSQFWTINNVLYRGRTMEVDLAKGLLDNGSVKTQEQWAEYSMKAKKQGEFYTPDYPLFYSILRSVKAGQVVNSQVGKEISSTIKEISRNHFLMTLTRIGYQPQGKDIVTHNFGMNDQYEIRERFVGQDGWISKLNDADVYEALLGTDKTQEIDEVFQWLNGTDAYLFRVNSRPSKLDERVAGFYAGSVGAGLGCVRYPLSSNSSLGVREAREKI